VIATTTKALIYYRTMPTAELPDDWENYYKEKGRDLPQHKVDPVSDLLQELDNATIAMLNHGGSKIRDGGVV